MDITDTISSMKKRHLAEKKAENNCVQAGQLVLWPEAERRMPNELIRSSLFSAKSKHLDREDFKDKKLFVWGSAELKFSGQELRASDDELIWLQICHYFRAVDVLNNEAIEFNTYELIKALKWPKNKQYYQKVEQSINRLDTNQVKVRTKREGVWKEYTFGLIRKFKKIETSNAIRWRVYLEPEALSMYDGCYYTKFPWEVYLKSSPTEKRILGWVLSHKAPLPIGAKELRGLLSSENDNNASFKQFINKAIKNLVKAGVIKSATWNNIKIGNDKSIELSVTR